MLTIFLIITLTNFQIILGTENNDTIFINSLPEKEKKDFLQKVEKRIQNEVPEVKSPELNDSNVELYEKHLEDQGKSVQNILRSEIESLKTHNRRNSNVSESRAEHVDLTLRTQKVESGATRRKLEGNGAVKDELIIPVVVQYDVNKHENSQRNTTTEMQNRNKNTDVKSGPKVDEITWENISLATNESSIERKRTGRRSNDLDTTLQEFNNATAVRSENNTNLSLDSINDTTTVSTTSNNVDSAKTTKYPLDESSKLESVNTTAPNVSIDTLAQNLKSAQDEPNITSTEGKDNTINEEVAVTNSTDETRSSTTPILFRAKSDDKIETTTQYTKITKANVDLSTTSYNNDEKTHNTRTIVDVTVNDSDSGSKTLDTTTSKSNIMSTEGKDNTINEEVTVTNSTDETSSSTTTILLRAKSDDKIETTTQYTKNTKANDDLSTTSYNNDEKAHNTSTIVDATVNDSDSGSKTPDITASKSSPKADPDLSNHSSDSVSKESSKIIENQPHYVPVYNYDPENAYFNTNSQQPDGNVTGEIMAINLNDTHSKATNIDVQKSNKNESSLRTTDVKESTISKDNIIPKSDLYNISDTSKEYSGDDAIFEKPLKHTLKKIRTNLYENKINNKSKHGENKSDTISIKAETKDKNDSSSYYTQEYDIYIHNVSELFKSFGFFLKNLGKSKTQFSKSKSDFYKDISDASIGILKNIINESDYQNKDLKNTHPTQITKIIKKDHSETRMKSLKKSKTEPNKEYQFRFHIKERDENYKQKDQKTSIEHGNISGPKVEHPDHQFEEPTKIHDEQLEMHVITLKDLVFRNDVGLEKYDWLGTTVRVRSALAKLQDITDKKINRIKLHYLDQKLLQFVMDLYETSKTLISKQNFTASRRKRLGFRIPKKGKKVNVLNRMYNELKHTRTARNIRSRQILADFKEFLDTLDICLQDLHIAIKQVSLVTKYKKQRWFRNIKQLYINLDKDKEYLELLLHLTTNRLMTLIDEIGKKDKPSDESIINDKAGIARIQVEFMMVLRICNKLMELRN